MKSANWIALLLFSVCTFVEPILAQDAGSSPANSAAPSANWLPAESVRSESWEHWSDLGLRINPQIGAVSMEYSGGGGGMQERPVGGATVEFGDDVKKLETGLMFMQTSANATLNDGTQERINSSYIDIPMMGKVRVLHSRSQSWYAKFGVINALQIGSSDRVNTNAFDVLAAAGVEARFPFSGSTEFIVDATYTHGFMDALDTASPGNFNQGVLVLAGLSFRL